MKRPNDDVLLRDMADYARMAVTVAAGKTREDLESDPLLRKAPHHPRALALAEGGVGPAGL